MIAVKTAASNHNFGPPPGKEDEIVDLPCQVETYEGLSTIYSVWEPSEGERRAIANGQNVRLGVQWVGVFPPVSIGVTDESAEA